MEPMIFRKMVQHNDINTSVVYRNIPIYMDTTGTRLADSGLSIVPVTELADRYSDILTHIDDDDIHVTTEDKQRWDEYIDTFLAHIDDTSVHVTQSEKDGWDAKETEEGAQAKVNIVQVNLDEHANNMDIHITNDERTHWNNTYSKEEIENKLAALVYNSDWKEAVQTYEDLFTTYPDPYEGWTVYVIDSEITYRFNGEEWVAISINSIPLATEEVDGLMSAEDKAKLNTIEEYANYYIHPDDENTRHVTDEQIAYWNDKADKTTATYYQDGLMSAEDKYKLDGIDDYATNYEQPDSFPASMIEEDENHRFVTDEEKTYWSNKADSNLASINLDGLMSSSDKKKLDTIETNANYYVLPSTLPATMIEEDETHRFVTDEQIAAWDAKAVSTEVEAGGDSAGLMSVEDKEKLDSIEWYANYYVHPDTHEATMIVQDETHMFVSAADIITWNNKKDADDIVAGDGIFNSTDGTVITHKLGGTNYAVSITVLDDPTDVGTVYVSQDNYSCTVYCTGTSTTAKFTYLLVKYYK